MSEEMEHELKFAGVDHAELRERLGTLDAESLGSPTLEDNWIFDNQGRLRSVGSHLRLRVDGRGARLSFRGAAVTDGESRRAEHETAVTDPAALREILEQLGYHAVCRYQKYREQWSLGSIVISLDHTPMGDFVEIEGEGSATVAERCGLDLEHAEPRNYLLLYEEHLAQNPGAPSEMLFPST